MATVEPTADFVSSPPAASGARGGARARDVVPAWDDQKVSEAFRKSIREGVRRHPKRQEIEARKRAGFEIQLDRHEAKYIIPRSMVPEIREFIRPFCQPDPHAHGDPPEYTVITLQLDSPQYSLHRAKEDEALDRFKLRVRTYGEPGQNPVFMEIKRKIHGTIVKSRCRVPFECWNEQLMRDVWLRLQFKTWQEETAFLEFKRLVQEIDARPVILIRYERESYFSRNDRYARISFDRRLCYQPTDSWDSWGRGRHWLPIDTGMVQNCGYPFSGTVLEVKTLSDTPHWMIDLVMNFSLVRIGHCKYSNAVWRESLFRGAPRAPDYAVDLFSF